MGCIRLIYLQISYLEKINMGSLDPMIYYKVNMDHFLLVRNATVSKPATAKISSKPGVLSV